VDELQVVSSVWVSAGGDGEEVVDFGVVGGEDEQPAKWARGWEGAEELGADLGCSAAAELGG
jgi:hypothetical protein